MTGSVSELPRIGEEFLASQPKDSAPKKFDPRNRDAGKKRVVIAGLFVEHREVITKKGTRMAFGKVEDLSGSCELVVFPDAFARVGHLLKDERPQLVGGLLEVSEGSAKIIVDSISPLEDILKKTKALTLRLESLEQDQLERLYTLLSENPGQTKVNFIIRLEDMGKEVVMESSEVKGIAVSNELFESIHSQLGRTDFIEMQ